MNVLLNRITSATACLLVVAACKPKEPTAAPQEPVAAPATPDSTAQKVVQAADPPELAKARQLYLAGSYREVIALLDPMLAQWQTPERQRTRALAQAWIALAHSEDMPENALSYVDGADQAARAIEDYEARQLANVARSAYLMGISEHENACKTLQRSLELSQTYVALTKLTLGTCLLNRAFSGDQVTDPGKLAEAQKIFEDMKSDGDPAISGRAYEGLAAVAKYRNVKPEVCTHAQAALKAYDSIQASAALREGPTALIDEGNCKG